MESAPCARQNEHAPLQKALQRVRLPRSWVALMADSRFIVGIDLGTTNSVLAWLDTSAGDADAPAIAVMPVPQLVKPGEVAARERLPSFLYLPIDGEFPGTGLDLPWGAAFPSGHRTAPPEPLFPRIESVPE